MGFYLFWEDHSINSVIIPWDWLIYSLSLTSVWWLFDISSGSRIVRMPQHGFHPSHSWCRNSRMNTFWREYPGSCTHVFMHITTRVCKYLHVSQLNRQHFLLERVSFYSGGLDQSHRTKWHKAVAAHVSPKCIFTSIWQKCFPWLGFHSCDAQFISLFVIRQNWLS